jgi:glyoxylase-like metal-dependent hydrolase (beta-lactamase superfamily II)
MEVRHFYDPHTFTLTYLVYDARTRDAVVIDPVLDFDPIAAQTSTGSVDEVSDTIKGMGLRLRYVLETHAHADHLTGSQLLRRRFEARVGIGARITVVQDTFKKIFDLPDDFPTDGRQFDVLIQDGEQIVAGSLEIEAIPTPGHTPACLTYRVGDAIFTGDALFVEDYGTGRCDFPRGSADDLYASVHDRLYALPDETRVFVGHDYLPGGRPLRHQTTIGAEKRENVQLRQATTREHFVAFRRQRDATLAQPRLLFPSIQVNIQGGRLPARHANGQRYLILPLNLKQPTDDAGDALEGGAA